MLGDLAGLQFACNSEVSSRLSDLRLNLLSEMTQCMYSLDYGGFLDFVGLFPHMGVNARISYARLLSGDIERQLKYFIT